MKKILLPIALFAAFGLAACGDDILDSECNSVSKSDLPDDTQSCKISEKVSDIGFCEDEATEKSYFTYKGSGEYDEAGLIKAACAAVTPQDKEIMVAQFSERAKHLISRIRRRVL